MKQIVYLCDYAGVDGRAKLDIVHATFDEAERTAILARNPYWGNGGEKIVDVPTARLHAITKLDLIDRLVLGITDNQVKSIIHESSSK